MENDKHPTVFAATDAKSNTTQKWEKKKRLQKPGLFGAGLMQFCKRGLGEEK